MTKIVKRKFKIEGMHCTSCAMNIDGELEDTEGVKESSTSYAKQVAEVTFDERLVSADQLIAIIRNLDEKYDAEEIKKYDE